MESSYILIEIQPTVCMVFVAKLKTFVKTFYAFFSFISRLAKLALSFTVMNKAFPS